MHEVAQEIKSKIDIVDFLSKYITMKRAGRNYKALCPFHQEKSPSFMVSPDRQNWRCFGSCQEGGDIISFLMKWENSTFYETIQELAKITGVSLTNFEIQDETYKRKAKLTTINREATKAYSYYLNHPKIGLEVREYLSKRNISDKLIATFHLGFAPPTKKALTDHLLKKGFKIQDLIDAGVSLKIYSGEIIDRFHNRLMFPIADQRGDIIGFSGRILDNNSQEGKYINTPETFVYKKRESLYGIHLTKKNIADKDCVVIVEGEFDMISCFKHGITNVVAIKGSALTDGQLTLLSRYTKNITLVLDADSSGVTTTKRVLPETEKYGFVVHVASYTGGKDPDEALQKDPIQFKKAVEKPDAVYDFIINSALQKYSLEDPYQKASLISDVGGFITSIENPIVRDHYVKKLSSLLEVGTDVIEKGFTSLKKKSSPVRKDQSEKTNATLEKEQFIATLFFQSPNCYELFQKHDSIIKKDIFTTPSISKLFELFEKFKNYHPQFDVALFAKTLPPELLDIFDKLNLIDIDNIDRDEFERKFTVGLLQLRRSRIKSDLTVLIKKKNNENKEDTIIQDLTKELSEIEKSLSIV